MWYIYTVEYYLAIKRNEFWYVTITQKNLFFFFLRFIYLFIQRERRERQRHRQREKQASMLGAGHGTQSWVSRITPWAKGGSKPLSHLGCPEFSSVIYETQYERVRSKHLTHLVSMVTANWSTHGLWIIHCLYSVLPEWNIKSQVSKWGIGGEE